MHRSIRTLVGVIALLAASGCEDKPPQWTELGRWEGRDTVMTDEFEMAGDTLRMIWLNDFGTRAGGNLLQVFVVDSAGKPFTLPVQYAGHREDTTDIVLQPGHRYRLWITPLNSRFELTALYKK